MDRKAFKFYKSYYDIALELSDPDRYEFLMALLEIQFTGEHRKLSGMANFAFVSQKHSINAQIEGFKARIEYLAKPPKQGGSKGALPQEKEEEQVQEKEEGKIITHGNKSENFFSVDSKYLHEQKHKVYEDGFAKFVEGKGLMGFTKAHHAKLFWQEWNGKLFNDIKHLNTVMINIINKKNG